MIYTENRKWTVYCHTNKINGKKYVGITSRSVKSRWRKNGKGYSDKRYFGKAIRKYGWDNFTHEIIAENLTESEAKSLEVLYIGMWNTKDRKYGYNLTDGGDGTLGVKISDKERERRRLAMIGNQNTKGYVPSEETREKLRNANTGKRHNDEARIKMHNAQLGNKKWLGKKHKDISKKLISENNPNRKSIKCLETKEVFYSIKEASKHFSISESAISTAIKENRKLRKGLTFIVVKN